MEKEIVLTRCTHFFVALEEIEYYKKHGYRNVQLEEIEGGAEDGGSIFIVKGRIN